jgi:RND superfamily putative drug exporter
MCTVFGSIALLPDRMLAQTGFAMAVAVLLDAVVIRCLMVPAVMRLLGDRAWWLPAALDRRLPQLFVEGTERRQSAGTTPVLGRRQ